jgi:hypothetical protein
MYGAHDYLVRQVPEPVVFLGLRLRQLSLGHYCILLRHANRFVLGEEPSLSDLLFATFVLTRSYAECVDSMAKGEHLTWAKDFAEKFEEEELALDDAINFLWDYIIEQLEQPPYRTKVKNYVELNSPLLVCVKIFLCDKMNLTANEALEYPWSLALYEYLCWLEQEGAIVLSTKADEEERMKAIEEFARKHPEFA